MLSLSVPFLVVPCFWCVWLFCYVDKFMVTCSENWTYDVSDKMIRVIGYGHFWERRKGYKWMELWKERCVFVKKRVWFGESSVSCWNSLQCKYMYWKWPRTDCANGNSCYRIVLITVDRYSLVYVYYITKIL